MVSLFFSKHNGVYSPSTLLIVIFWVIFWVSSLPMSVTTHSDCCLHTNYFAEGSYFCHIPPLGSLLLYLSYPVVVTPLMATDLAVTPHLYPLFLLLAAQPSKLVLDNYTTVPRWYLQNMGTPAGSGVHIWKVTRYQPTNMNRFWLSGDLLLGRVLW